MKSMQTELSGIKELREARTAHEANELIKEGWKLLAIVQYSRGKETWGYYVLGRSEKGVRETDAE